MDGLMSYGTDPVDVVRRSTRHIDKILEDAKPADLPMEQPMRYDFVINLKTAKELGRPAPRALLVQATRVI